ncbi:cytochrome b-c1 complex subunit 7 [Entophlyctis helioformis]|nr:cytochrome b-c1 complex subunit 7 [Entophlyctis helioformis]
MKFLETLRSLRSSQALTGLAEWHANLMGYRQMGLRFDDLVPDESDLVQEALRRLPPREFQDRHFRFKRALNLSMLKTQAPREEWTTAATDIAYLSPYINLVEAEIQTKENFDNLDSIPAALRNRNRSS